MEKVTGIGGVFFKAGDPEKLASWYREQLGIDSADGFFGFEWRKKEAPEQIGRTIWSLFPADTQYFNPSKSPFMVNYRVANLDKMLQQLRANGVEAGHVESSEFGRFAWVSDPEGNRIELWEPPVGG